jgi:ubiquinone/menaquinone biosynthesis C-methylase UbiE
MKSAGGAKPANYLFKQANALDTFPFAESSFDYVHMRLMLLSIPEFKWSDVLHEILRVTRPAGWIEFVEVGCTIWPQGPATQKWYSWIRETCTSYSHDADMPARLKIMALKAGIRNVKEFTYDIPIGNVAGACT